jgi:hypothetical protein
MTTKRIAKAATKAPRAKTGSKGAPSPAGKLNSRATAAPTLSLEGETIKTLKLVQAFIDPYVGATTDRIKKNIASLLNRHGEHEQQNDLHETPSLAGMFIRELANEMSSGDQLSIRGSQAAWLALASSVLENEFPPRTKASFDRDGVMRVLGARDGYLHALCEVERVIKSIHGPYSGNFPARQTKKIRERDAILAPLKDLAESFQKSMEDCLAAYEKNNKELEEIKRSPTKKRTAKKRRKS